MIRRTAQREAIRSLFQPDTDPMSPQEILEHASKTVPTVGIATVYRTVRALVEQGEIVAVELPGEPPRYEMAGKEHHHHFVCESCGKAFDIDACPGNLAHMTPKGFTLNRHDITLFGLCDGCVKNS
ncbi:MAG: Fur family transcriptional regulator [Phycisphaerales bacterium JB052]